MGWKNITENKGNCPPGCPTPGPKCFGRFMDTALKNQRQKLISEVELTDRNKLRSTEIRWSTAWGHVLLDHQDLLHKIFATHPDLLDTSGLKEDLSPSEVMPALEMQVGVILNSYHDNHHQNIKLPEQPQLFDTVPDYHDHKATQLQLFSEN